MPRTLRICLACGGRIEPALQRHASPRCHNRRSASAQLRPDLVATALARHS